MAGVGIVSTPITTSSLLKHTPFVMVQRNVTDNPDIKPLTVLPALLLSVITTVPETTLHTPFPTIAALADSVAVLTTPHKLWSTPALAMLGNSSIQITTSSLVSEQTPLLIVHLNVTQPGIVNPVTSELGSVESVIVATPLITVQLPLPTDGVFPESVAVLELQSVWSAPVVATVGKLSTLIITSFVELGHAPLLIVHTNVALAPFTKLDTSEVGSVVFTRIAVPLTTVQLPVPTIGVLPVSVAVVTSQSIWSTPVMATVGKESTLTITSSTELGHIPLLIVHCRVVPDGMANPVNPLLGSFELVTVAVPLTTLHKPFPTVAAFADSVVLATLQRDWSTPALATVGDAST